MKKQKTFYPKKLNAAQKWFVLDAKDKVLGRLASDASKILLSKFDPDFTPGFDNNNHVIIINADKVKVTGKKKNQKVYYRHTGYTGNLKSIVYKDLFSKFPDQVIYKAVKGMIPHNKYGSQLLTKLKIYNGDDHPHIAQNPIVFKGVTT